MFHPTILSSHWVGIAFIGGDKNNWKGFLDNKYHQYQVVHQAKNIENSWSIELQMIFKFFFAIELA
jgi:hypothetical protein